MGEGVAFNISRHLPCKRLPTVGSTSKKRGRNSWSTNIFSVGSGGERWRACRVGVKFILHVTTMIFKPCQRRIIEKSLTNLASRVEPELFQFMVRYAVRYQDPLCLGVEASEIASR